MPVDLSVDMIKATVQLEQSLGDGQRTVGTGFLLDAPTPDGRPRTILVTAAHVLQKMPAQQASIGYRFQTQAGWRFDPQPLTIRIPGGQGKWTQHPTRDIAAMEITAPPEFARAAIPRQDGGANGRRSAGRARRRDAVSVGERVLGDQGEGAVIPL